MIQNDDLVRVQGLLVRCAKALDRMSNSLERMAVVLERLAEVAPDQPKPPRIGKRRKP